LIISANIVILGDHSNPHRFGSRSVPQVAFQGEEGAYSQQAALAYFKNSKGAVTCVACPDFQGVFAAVSRGRTRYGILPVENSLTGSIHQNYDLLLKHKVWICGETKLKIEHTLIGLKGASLAGLRQVFSHPQALRRRWANVKAICARRKKSLRYRILTRRDRPTTFSPPATPRLAPLPAKSPAASRA
jgi:hypothetical protein